VAREAGAAGTPTAKPVAKKAAAGKASKKTAARKPVKKKSAGRRR
jgi:hypothetical protein